MKEKKYEGPVTYEDDLSKVEYRDFTQVIDESCLVCEKPAWIRYYVNPPGKYRSYCYKHLPYPINDMRQFLKTMFDDRWAENVGKD